MSGYQIFALALFLFLFLCRALSLFHMQNVDVVWFGLVSYGANSLWDSHSRFAVTINGRRNERVIDDARM